jgi:phosphate transport system permease protein
MTQFSVTTDEATELPPHREIVVQRSRGDRIFRGIVSAGALSSLVLLGLIAIFLIVRSGEIFGRFGLDFITKSDWTTGVEPDGSDSSYGVWAMLLGTIIVSLIAVVVALPLSVGAALFVEFYLPERLRSTVRLVIDIAAAVPSVVYGLWAVAVFTNTGASWGEMLNRFAGWFPLFGVENEQFDRSPFMAGLVLAIMIIPIITSVAREVFSRTPPDLVSASYALGGSRWGSIRNVVLPYGSSGVVGGTMLGLGRALGETVAVYLVLNLVFKPNLRILESQGGNVASLIATKFGEATEYEIKALLAAGFVLFILTMAVNMTATYIVQKASPLES